MKSQRKKTLRKSSENRKAKRSCENNTLRVYLKIFLIVVVLFACFVFYAYFSYKDDVLSVVEINATLNVSDYVGFNLDKDKLHFGTVFPGGTGTRDLGLVSSEDGYLYVTASQNVQNWIFASSQNEKISKDVYFPLIIAARPPVDAAGNYDFEIRIFILEKRANFITRMMLGKGVEKITFDGSEQESAKVRVEITNSTE